MKWIFKLSYILFFWLFPIYYIISETVYVEDTSGYNIPLMMKIIVSVALFIFYKQFNKQVEIWEIQDRYDKFRKMYFAIKGTFLMFAVFWVWESMNASYDKVHTILLVVLVSFTVGLFFRIMEIIFTKDNQKELVYTKKE